MNGDPSKMKNIAINGPHQNEYQFIFTINVLNKLV